MTYQNPTSNLLHNGWFGKAVAGVCALQFTPPDWQLAVLMVAAAVGMGHGFDSWMRRRSAPHGRWVRWQNHHALETTSHFAFVALGHLAKTGGPVLKTHIDLVESLMTELEFDAGHRQQAIAWFNDGKNKLADLDTLARRCRQQWRTKPVIREFTLIWLCRCALVRQDLTVEAALITLGMLMEVSPTELQTRRSQLLDQVPTIQSTIQQAYQALDLPPDAGVAAAKRAYRQLVARYHPDRLSATATYQELAYHERRMHEIRTAYEAITRKS